MRGMLRHIPLYFYIKGDCMFSEYLHHLLIELRPFVKEALALFLLAFPVFFGLVVLVGLFARFVCFIRRKYIWNRKDEL